MKKKELKGHINEMSWAMLRLKIKTEYKITFPWDIDIRSQLMSSISCFSCDVISAIKSNFPLSFRNVYPNNLFTRQMFAIGSILNSRIFEFFRTRYGSNHLTSLTGMTSLTSFLKIWSYYCPKKDCIKLTTKKITTKWRYVSVNIFKQNTLKGFYKFIADFSTTVELSNLSAQIMEKIILNHYSGQRLLFFFAHFVFPILRTALSNHHKSSET